MIFDLDGNQTRKRRKPCRQCGAMEECDDCWEHVFDWSPFGIWTCPLCETPVVYCDGYEAPLRCDYCGWDDKLDTIRNVWDDDKKAFVRKDWDEDD